MIGRTDREQRIKEKLEAKLKNCSPVFGLFYVAMRDENKSLATIDVYLNNILHFANFHTDITNSFFVFKDVTSNEIEEYLSSLKKGGSGDDILQGRWSSLNTFFTWAEKKGYVEKNPLISVPRPKNEKKHAVTYLTKEEISNLLKVIDKNTDEKFILRDKTVISLALTTALRIGALVNLNIADVDLVDKTIIVKEGAKKRKIRLGDNTVSLLSNWLKYRNSQFARTSSTALFLSKNYDRMPTEGINYMIAKYCNWAGLPKLVFSDLTETAICNLIEHHIPLQTIMDEYGFDRNERLIAYVEAVFNNRNESSQDVLDALISSSSNTSFYKDNYVGNDPNNFEIENGVLIKYTGDEDAKTIIIPNTVERISNSAFDDSGYKSKKIIIPDSVIDIDDGAFDWCEFENIIVDINNLKYCSDSGVLFNKEKTELIRYPEGKSEEHYTIPSSVSIVHDGAFLNCKNLECVNIQTGIVDIGNKAFQHCNRLADVFIPESVESIGNYAFDGCSNLSKITVSPGNNVWSDIDGVLFANYKARKYGLLYCFPNNKEVEDYFVPNGVLNIWCAAFAGCLKLQSVYVPNTVETIHEEAFRFCRNLKEITGLKGVLNIGCKAFARCVNLAYFDIPLGVEYIYEQTFYACKNLKRISMPGSIKEIDEHAFVRCDNLTEVRISRQSKVSVNLFKNCNTNCKITRV